MSASRNAPDPREIARAALHPAARVHEETRVLARAFLALEARGSDSELVERYAWQLAAQQPVIDALKMMLEMYDRHAGWCGYNKDAPGDMIHKVAPEAARAALRALDSEQTVSGRVTIPLAGGEMHVTLHDADQQTVDALTDLGQTAVDRMAGAPPKEKETPQ